MKAAYRCAYDWPPQSGNEGAKFIGECRLSSTVNPVNRHADRSIW